MPKAADWLSQPGSDSIEVDELEDLRVANSGPGPNLTIGNTQVTQEQADSIWRDLSARYPALKRHPAEAAEMIRAGSFGDTTDPRSLAQAIDRIGLALEERHAPSPREQRRLDAHWNTALENYSEWPSELLDYVTDADVGLQVDDPRVLQYLKGLDPELAEEAAGWIEDFAEEKRYAQAEAIAQSNYDRQEKAIEAEHAEYNAKIERDQMELEQFYAQYGDELAEIDPGVVGAFAESGAMQHLVENFGARETMERLLQAGRVVGKQQEAQEIDGLFAGTALEGMQDALTVDASEFIEPLAERKEAVEEIAAARFAELEMGTPTKQEERDAVERDQAEFRQNLKQFKDDPVSLLPPDLAAELEAVE